MIDKIKEIIPNDILKKIKSYLWLCRNCKEEFMNLENKWIYNKNFIYHRLRQFFSLFFDQI